MQDALGYLSLYHMTSKTVQLFCTLDNGYPVSGMTSADHFWAVYQAATLTI